MTTKQIQIVGTPPLRATEHSAACDLTTTEEFLIYPGERRLVKTGIRIALPVDCCALILPRSGLALKHGITVANAPGLIDADYRGEIGVILINHGEDIPGYEGSYQIDDFGRVYSCARVISSMHPTQKTKTICARELKTSTDTKGYKSVRLCLLGKEKVCRVHRLMMMSFEYRDGCKLLDVNHIDGNRLNNSLSNLEWATRSENIRHSFNVLNRTRTMAGKFGALHHNAKPVIGYNKKTGEKVHEFDSLSSAGRAGFEIGKISLCLSGKRKTHGGFVWVGPDIEPFVCRSGAE